MNNLSVVADTFKERIIVRMRVRVTWCEQRLEDNLQECTLTFTTGSEVWEGSKRLHPSHLAGPGTHLKVQQKYRQLSLRN